MRQFLPLSAFIAGLVLGGAQAAAYEDQYNAAVATCTIPPVEALSCEAAVQIYLVALADTGLTPLSQDASVASFVVALVRSTPDMAAVSAPIAAVGPAIADPVVADLVLDVGNALAAGTTPDLDPLMEFVMRAASQTADAGDVPAAL